MTVADALLQWLGQEPTAGGERIVGWHFEIAEGQGVRAGIRDSCLGGPYEGPGLASRLSGTLELHWSDGLLTRTGLDRRALMDPSAELESWRDDAVADRRGHLPPLAGPAVPADVQVFDPEVADTMEGGVATVLGTLQRMLDRGRSSGLRRVDAVMRASRTWRTVATSRGFHAAWSETSCSIDLWGDEITGASYGRRCRPSDADVDRLADEVATLAPRLAVVNELPPSARGVLFAPAVVDDLIGRLLLPNLSGRSIRDGRSPFSRADLEAARQVIGTDLDLTIDTTLPFEPATAPCSSEGVPAGRIGLIVGGRLASPILDLATAAQFGLPPTPVPRGRPSALLTSSRPELSFDEALTLLGDGVVVRALPGLHTQQARRSSYALVAPDAQVVNGGEGGGRCAVRLAGKLLDHLSQPSTRLVRIPGSLSIGLLVLGGVELLPA